MSVELIQTTTADYLTLHGALRTASSSKPAASTGPTDCIDAALLVHGVGSNFYNSPLLTTLAKRLTAARVTVLCANTRGHDFVSIIRSALGPRRYGAAYEQVHECCADIDAWLKLLVARGHRRIALIGHSLGAIKALYAAAHTDGLAVQNIVAISTPCLSFSRFRNGPRAKLFAKYFAQAKDRVEQGAPLSLLRVKYPFPLLITAGSYLDKYGPSERYNILRFAHLVPCPTLYLYGQRELESGSVAFADLPAALEALPNDRGYRRSCMVIPSADHVYSGYEDVVDEQIVRWL